MKNITINSNKKQSLITGGLIISAGFFLAKFISIFYAVPYNSILGSPANIAYYGTSYSIYSYILSVCTAGFPYAMAVMIARSAAFEDYHSVILIRKVAIRVMLALGLFSMTVMIIFSSSLAELLLPDYGNNVQTMQVVLVLISFALFFVPILSALRGFYQGLKQLEIYSLSQVLEQIARVIFLLVASAVTIYIFQKDNIWAVYFGVLAASVSAILAIVHLLFYDRTVMPQIKELAKNEQSDSKSLLSIFKELTLIAFPFLLVAIFGYSDAIINTIFVNKGLEAFGSTSRYIELVSGSINYSVLKLMAIPMVLAPGFSAAIIPHITSSLAKNDKKAVKKSVSECIEIVLYIAIPVSFCLFVFAKPIYANMFPPENYKNLDLLVSVLSWFSIEAFLSTMGPVISSVLMAVGLQKINIRNQMIMVVIKFAITFQLMKMFGFVGIVLSSLIATSIFFVLNINALQRSFKIQWKYTVRRIGCMLVGLVGLYISAQLLNLFGIRGYDVGRLIGFTQLFINGGLAVIVYIAITSFLQIPQSIFHFSYQKLWLKIKRGKNYED